MVVCNPFVTARTMPSKVKGEANLHVTDVKVTTLGSYLRQKH